MTPIDRRHFLKSLGPLVGAPALVPFAPLSTDVLQSVPNRARLRITSMETLVVRATQRTNWIFVRLATNQG